MKSHRTCNKGIISYRSRGKYYRENGPALIFPDGTTWWIKDGMYHREELPSFIEATGRRAWYIDGKHTRRELP